MKKKLFIVCAAISLVLSGCSVGKSVPEKGNVITEENIKNESSKPGSNIPVLRSMAAKMLALSFSSIEEISNMDKEINFKDVDENSWYYPYINRICYLGLMRGTDDGFLPDEPLNLKQVQIILEEISGKKIEYNKANEEKPVSCSLWTELLYEALQERFEELDIKVEDLAIFATAESGNMPPWTVATDKGVFKCDGYATDAYTDKTIKAIVKENEIIGILSVEKDYAEINNAYVRSIGDETIEVFYETGKRTFKYSGDINMPIANIKIDSGDIVEIDIADSNFRDVVKLVDSSKISSKSQGNIKISDDFKVYDITDSEVITKSKSSLLIGSDIAKIYSKSGTAWGAVIDKKIEPNNLRIVLSTTGFTGYIHNKVSLGSDSGLIIKTGTETLEAKSIKLPEDDARYFSGTDRIYIEPAKGGNIEVSSIERKWQDSFPKYEGAIEIEKREEGYVVVNEVDMETYLMAVVPSEMPSSYGLEAAKVQAICARSYAYNQFYSNKYHEYGANIDDSVMSQVYNNIPANEISEKAVKATEAMYLGYNGEIVSANFFSTSCGSFANSGDVWSSGNVFPSGYKEYLRAHNVIKQNLSDEDAMRKFIMSDESGYDTWSEWSRWKITMSQEELSSVIEKNLEKAYNSYPYLVKTLQEDELFKSRPISELGRIKDIKVLRRGEGGNIMGLKIDGEKNTVLLRTEYIIRTVLSPIGTDENPVKTVLKSGKEISNYSLMPSAYFVFDIDKNEEGFVNSITFIGGGNGHGVGMSQNGVKQMTEEGKTYQEVLSYYYKGTEILTK